MSSSLRWKCCNGITQSTKKLNYNSSIRLFSTSLPSSRDKFTSPDKTASNIQKNNQAALNATSLGAAVNVALAASKGFLGFSVGSTALIADCFNSVGDLFSDGVVYYTVTEARRGATPEKPWGSGKIEPLGIATALILFLAPCFTYCNLCTCLIIGAFVVGGLLGVTGLGIAYAGAVSILDYFHILSSAQEILPLPLLIEVVDPHSVTDLTSLSPTQYGALGISCLSVVTKEFLFRYTLKAGTKANSNAVIANAWQHRSDAMVSGAVFAGLAGSYVGFPILDPLAGLAVAVVILKQVLPVHTPKS